ncbi:hypothetical protein O181_074414 [Austropuccinia psidii MF-1]|uniref:Uncharacterized protein n=1 Tax=Austropuccinia psidii MF-1 TaxID=1389203 RepID=A0A9Q3IDG1_9BASI|nr:hypothetical protein [Austropuccinia psidii MF-1]
MAGGHSILGKSSPCLVTHGIQMPKEQNPPNPLLQETPVPLTPRDQTLRQPAPGLSGTQWLEDLLRGLSPSPKPHEDVSACEPEPEVASAQSSEEPFGY